MRLRSETQTWFSRAESSTPVQPLTSRLATFNALSHMELSTSAHVGEEGKPLEDQAARGGSVLLGNPPLHPHCNAKLRRSTT